jgi:hypothetical protein
MCVWGGGGGSLMEHVSIKAPLHQGRPGSVHCAWHFLLDLLGLVPET